MLSRRHLRIKVLQALYGAEENSTTSVGVKEKNLFSVLDDKGRVVLFMAEKNKLTGIQFDDSFQINDSLSIPFNPKELKKMSIGIFLLLLKSFAVRFNTPS